MVVQISTSDRRKALRSLKQRGFVVHVGAVEALYQAYESLTHGSFANFLDKTLDLLGRPNGAKDGILTKDLAVSVGQRLKQEKDRKEGIGAASVEVIDSFSLPKWRPQAVATSHLGSAGTKIHAPAVPVVDAAADAKGAMFRLRYELVLSKTLRNPRFRPPSDNSISLTKRSPYFQLTGIESLSGSAGEKFVLAMLTQLEEGSWFLEDINGTVKADLSEASITAGLHTECSFVIAQGTLQEEDGEEPIFHVSAMGTPPFEAREDSLVTLGRDANLFGGQYDPSESVELLRMEEEAKDVSFMLVSDVALDNSRVVAGLRHVFRGYMEDNFFPTVIVLMGNFLSHPFGQQLDDVATLQEKFGELGDMIKTDFSTLAEQSIFVIVPGTNDPGPGNVLPRPQLPNMITRHFIESLGSENVHLATNPCRIRYLTQEIVILRDDIMQKMVRHCSVKPDFGESGCMSEHLIKSVVDQAYLSPLPLSARPVLWNHDHALWLFPTPHTIVIGDRVDSYICEYGGSLGLNPGSFSTDFSFQIYLPAQKRAQQCSIDSEDVTKCVEETKNSEQEHDGMELSNPPMVGQQIESDGETEGDDQQPFNEHEEVHLEERVLLDQVSEAKSLHLDNESEERRSKEDGEGENSLNESDVERDAERDTVARQQHSDQEDDGIESDDDSMLIPADGIKRLDIKTLVRNAIAVDESHPEPDSGSDEDS